MESFTNLAQGPALRPSPLLVMMERACLAGQTHGLVNIADVGCYPVGGRTHSAVHAVPEGQSLRPGPLGCHGRWRMPVAW